MKRKLLSIVAVFLVIAIFSVVFITQRSNDERMCIGYLENLSDDALLELIAPFNLTIENANTRYSTESWQLLPFCITEDGRYHIINTLATTCLAEFEISIMEAVQLYFTLDDWNMVCAALLDSDLDTRTSSLIRRSMGNTDFTRQVAGFLEDGGDMNYILDEFCIDYITAIIDDI